MRSVFTDPRNGRVDELMQLAEAAERDGDSDAARDRWSDAAELLTELAESIGRDKPRVRGAYEGGAASAWRRAGDKSRCAKVVRAFLADRDSLPAATVQTLEEILSWADPMPSLLDVRKAVREPSVVRAA